jgi:poly(hydroxyalkanoate) depolymerase family esterase
MMPVLRRSRRKVAGSARSSAMMAVTDQPGAIGTAGVGSARTVPRAAQAGAPRRGTWSSATYRGRAGTRTYFVYVPAGIRRNSRTPLVVALHGCAQTAADFAATTRFNDLADRRGFVVVYPEQTSWNHQQRCWHWYESAHQQRGAGEPAIIAGITAEVVAATGAWRIDPARVYVTGLSAGGAMALVLAATYPEMFAAVGVHSAPAYRSAASAQHALGAMAGRTVVPSPVTGAARPMPPTILFHGTTDQTVRVSNGQRVAEQWLAFCRACMTGPRDGDRITRSRTTPGHTADGREYTITRWYTARGRTMLEYWQVKGLGHAWSGGAAGASYSDPLGPRASTAMWRFFAARQLPAQRRRARTDVAS